MTNFFLYEEMTWPEVAALPRDLPLVLPLGSGYNLEQLASALGNPPQIRLLPVFPFGWEGSGITLPKPVLTACLANLLDSLRDDGFSRVFAMVPKGLEPGLGSDRIAVDRPGINRMQPAMLFTPADAGKVVLIPIGHTEQHGYHLPLSTDTLIIQAVSQGTAAASSGEALSLPVMPYGVSMHRASYAGTMNAGGRAFEDFWVAVVDHLVERGFSKFYLLSGHGGNSSFLVNVVKYAGDRHKRIFCATAFLYLSGSQGVEALEKHRLSKIGGMGHACELETSFILHLRPDLVHMERVVDETDFISTPNYFMDWIEGGALVANPPWYDDTATGAYGAGSLATAEHGSLWLDAAIAEKVVHVREINEQHRHREERRLAGYGMYR